MMDYIDLPDWLQRLWEIKPELAKEAEKYIDKLKAQKMENEINELVGWQNSCSANARDAGD